MPSVLSWGLAAAALLGCSSSNEVPVDEDAILSRASLDTHVCRVERPHTRYEPTQSSTAGPSLAVTTGGKSFLSRIDNPFPYPEPVNPPELFVAPIDTAGTLGARTKPDDRSPVAWGAPSIARYDDGLAVAWDASGTLRVALLGADGAVVHEATDIAGAPINTDYSEYRPRLVQGSDGNLGIAYVTSGTRTELRFVLVDANLTPVTPSRVIGDMPKGYSMGFNVVAAGGGYAFAWTGLFGETSAPTEPMESQGLSFVTVDATGAERTPAQRIPASDGRQVVAFGFDTLMVGLIETRDGFLASWVEHDDRYSVVQVVPLDPQGSPTAGPVSLRQAEDAVDEVEPSFARFGDAVAVLWARGSHIFECGGCTPDHRIDLVLIDQQTLDPLSDIVSVERTAVSSGFQPSGGLLARDQVVLGSKILTAYQQQYHTTADLASATFACEVR
jgi:hypothetical protein